MKELIDTERIYVEVCRMCLTRHHFLEKNSYLQNLLQLLNQYVAPLNESSTIPEDWLSLHPTTQRLLKFQSSFYESLRDAADLAQSGSYESSTHLRVC